MSLGWCTELQGRAKVIVDGRQIIAPEKVGELGFVYRGIGYKD
jgi:hypothetical protein